MGLLAKKCSKCGQVKDRTEFYKDKTRKDRLHYCCKKCIKEYDKHRRKKYYQENKEIEKDRRKKYRQENPETIAKRKARYKKTEKGKEAKRKEDAKRRRQLGYTPLNKPFEGSVGHHITNIYVVYILKSIHLKCAFPNTKQHRANVSAYFGGCMFRMILGLPPKRQLKIEWDY